VFYRVQVPATTANTLRRIRCDAGLYNAIVSQETANPDTGQAPKSYYY